MLFRISSRLQKWLGPALVAGLLAWEALRLFLVGCSPLTYLVLVCIGSVSLDYIRRSTAIPRSSAATTIVPTVVAGPPVIVPPVIELDESMIEQYAEALYTRMCTAEQPSAMSRLWSWTEQLVQVDRLRRWLCSRVVKSVAESIAGGIAYGLHGLEVGGCMVFLNLLLEGGPCEPLVLHGSVENSMLLRKQLRDLVGIFLSDESERVPSGLPRQLERELIVHVLIFALQLTTDFCRCLKLTTLFHEVRLEVHPSEILGEAQPVALNIETEIAGFQFPTLRSPFQTTHRQARGAAREGAPAER